MTAPNLATKLPKVGTTIFTVMSQLAAEYRAVNLGQGTTAMEVRAASFGSMSFLLIS